MNRNSLTAKSPPLNTVVVGISALVNVCLNRQVQALLIKTAPIYATRTSRICAAAAAACSTCYCSTAPPRWVNVLQRGCALLFYRNTTSDSPDPFVAQRTICIVPELCQQHNILGQRKARADSFTTVPSGAQHIITLWTHLSLLRRELAHSILSHKWNEIFQSRLI